MSRRIIATNFLICSLITTSSFAVAESNTINRIPCSETGVEPFYIQYGIITPKDWRCTAVSLDGKKTFYSYRWEKSKKQISLFDAEEDKSVFAEVENQLPDIQAKFPMKWIRFFVEAYLGDSKMAKYSKFMDYSIKNESMYPKAVLFSPDNKKTVIYKNEGLSATSKGEMRNSQKASVFLKGNDEHFLDLFCYGCTPDEFFSLIINPAIQQ